MVGVAIAFVTTRRTASILLLSLAAVLFGVALMVALLRDLRLRALLTVRCAGESKKSKGYIRGYDLTGWAQRMLAGDAATLAQSRVPSLKVTPKSADELFCKSGKDLKAVWTPESVAKAHQDVALPFIVWIAAGCMAISCAAILLEKAVAPS